MCFLRSSAVLLLAAAFAAARPTFSGNRDDDNGFGGYSASSGLGGLTGGYLDGNYGSGSNSYNSQRTQSVTGASNAGYGFDAARVYGSGFGNNGNDFSGSNSASARGYGLSGASDNGMSGNRMTSVSGNGFNGISGNGFKGFGSFSSVPGVLFAFPSLTSVSYSRIPQQDNDLAALAILSALIADSENLNDDDNDASAVQTVSRQTYTDIAARDMSDNNNQRSKVAFVPVVAVPSAAKQQKTTKIVKTTIETDGSVSGIPGLNGDLADIATGPGADSYDANGDSSASSRRSYSSSAASSSSSSSSNSGSSSRMY